MLKGLADCGLMLRKRNGHKALSSPAATGLKGIMQDLIKGGRRQQPRQAYHQTVR
jgi:hypothetical protein